MKPIKQVYDMYIRSDAWKAKRRQVFARYGKICSKCRTRKPPIHIHHLHYRSFGDESMEDLQVLCENCHREAHGMKFLDPNRKISKRKSKKWRRETRFERYKKLYDPTIKADRERMKRMGLHVPTKYKTVSEYMFFTEDDIKEDPLSDVDAELMRLLDHDWSSSLIG